MCVILTAAANGNVAAAVCNAVTSNMAGIFATPALLFHFFGSSNKIQLPFLDMLLKLSQKVLLPVGIGQALRLTPLKHLFEKNSKFFKRLQEVILLSILWNAFCNAISSNSGLHWRHALAFCLVILPTMHLAVFASIFVSFSKLGFDRRDVVAAMFCASQKTLAFGLPLVNTIFQGSPHLASYTAPVMFLHPIQLILGSLLISRLETYTANNQQQHET
jgi:sodium/bile acid cotransporter 7